MLKNIHAWRERTWAWFKAHAEGPYALPWLAAISFADAIFFPVAPEIFIVALVVAQPRRWRDYFWVAWPASVLGAAVAYFIARTLFVQFGEPLIALYHLETSFAQVQGLIQDHAFLTMALGNFTLIPDKAFIYAGGFLGASFLPFIGGYAVGRGLRFGVGIYLAERFGERALAVVDRYFLPISIGALGLIAFLFLRVF